MARIGDNLAKESENKKNLHPYRDIALERRKRTQANRRTHERDLRKAYGARCRCHHSPDGSEFLEDRAIHGLC